MIKLMKLYLAVLGISLLAFSAPLPASAISPADKIREGVNTAAGEDDKATTRDLGTLVKTIINIFSVIVGAIAVIMLIYGGFRFVTSAGNDAGVQAAKNTILYAIIGLIVVALAQVIVRFVLLGVSNDPNP